MSLLTGRGRVTATFRRADGGALHVRKTVRTAPDQRAILDALGIESLAGGMRKMTV